MLTASAKKNSVLGKRGFDTHIGWSVVDKKALRHSLLLGEIAAAASHYANPLGAAATFVGAPPPRRHAAITLHLASFPDIAAS